METGLGPLEPQDIGIPYAGKPGAYSLAYLGPNQSAMNGLTLPEDSEFLIEIIDTWDMKIMSVEGSSRGKFDLELPGRPYTALRITSVA